MGKRVIQTDIEQSEESFKQFFKQATGDCDPFPYQWRFADSERTL